MANFIPQIPNGSVPNFQQLTGTPSVSNPYGNVTFSPFSYDNYMGKINSSQNMQNPIQFLKCRPVSSKEEAIASQIDLDGSLWVFTDVGNGKIYTKQINSDGTATFKTYTQAADDTYSNEYVTKDEFNKVVQSLVAAIQQNSTAMQKQQEAKNAKDTKEIPLNF